MAPVAATRTVEHGAAAAAPLAAVGVPDDARAVLPDGAVAILQSAPDVTGTGPLAVVVTFLLAALFYAVTLHLAATFFLGDVPSQRAAKVAAVPALVSLLLQQWGAAVVVPVTLLGDGIAIAAVYELEWRPATALTLLHFAFATVLGLALGNLLGVV